VVATLAWLRTTPPPPAGEALLGQVAPPAAPLPTPEVGQVVPPPVTPPPLLPTAPPTQVKATPTQAFAKVVWATATSVPWVPPTEEPPTATPTPPIEKVFTCEKGAKFSVSPEDAEVWIEGKKIGTADDWDDMGGGKVFKFSQPGSYYVRLALKGYKTAWIKIVVKSDAKEDVANVDTELKED